MDALLLAGLGAAAAVLGSAAWAGLRGAPFVPTSSDDVRRMIAAADLRDGDIVVDLGCGDGRLLIAAAEHPGVRAVGYELSLVPLAVAKLRVRRNRLQQRIEIRAGDFFHQDLSAATVVMCFLTPAVMPRLREKILAEAAPGTRIVSRVFRIPGLPNERQDKPAPDRLSIWSYRI